MRLLSKKTPQVSIVMNSHNGEDFINQSIKSIISQNYKNWELIFWDNCSNDESKKIIYNFKDKRIRYFYSKKFHNLYKARNLAIKKAKGKYICFLDVDDQWKKNKIKDQLLSINNSNTFIVYSNFIMNNKVKKIKKKRSNSKLPEGKITQALLNDYFLGINTVMIPRNFFRNYKFNESYNIIGDFDLFLRLSLKYKFICVQKTLAIYNFHGKNMSVIKLKLYIKELKNWIKINEKKFQKKYDFSNLKKYLFKLRLKDFFGLFVGV